jgi:hypothetical protein
MISKLCVPVQCSCVKTQGGAYEVPNKTRSNRPDASSTEKSMPLCAAGGRDICLTLLKTSFNVDDLLIQLHCCPLLFLQYIYGGCGCCWGDIPILQEFPAAAILVAVVAFPPTYAATDANSSQYRLALSLSVI